MFSVFPSEIWSIADLYRKWAIGLAAKRKFTPDEVFSLDRDGTRRREDFYYVHYLENELGKFHVVTLYVLDSAAMIPFGSPLEEYGKNALMHPPRRYGFGSINEYPPSLVPEKIGPTNPIPVIGFTTVKNLETNEVRLVKISKKAIGKNLALYPNSFERILQDKTSVITDGLMEDPHMAKVIKRVQSGDARFDMVQTVNSELQLRTARALGGFLKNHGVPFVSKPYANSEGYIDHSERLPVITGTGRSYAGYINMVNITARLRGHILPATAPEILAMQARYDFNWAKMEARWGDWVWYGNNGGSNIRNKRGPEDGIVNNPAEGNRNAGKNDNVRNRKGPISGGGGNNPVEGGGNTGSPSRR